VVPKVLSGMVLGFVDSVPSTGSADYFTSTIQQKSACAESVKGATHWSADVVQSTLVLVLFIVVPKVLSGMVLSFVTLFLILLALTIL
jgi:hypothetical protein